MLILKNQYKKLKYDILIVISGLSVTENRKHQTCRSADTSEIKNILDLRVTAYRS